MLARIVTVGIVISFVVAALVGSAAGQYKALTYSDVFKMEQSALMLLRSLPHRSSMTSWVFPERGKEASYKTVLIRETMTADRFRWIQENYFPGSFKRMEVVTIGEKNYRKIDEEPWAEFPTPPAPIAVPATPSGAKVRFEHNVRLVETVNSGRGPISVYEVTTRSVRTEPDKEVTRNNSNRYWFSYDGKLLRKDMEMETVGEARIFKNSTVYEYEGIKIEAPTM